MAGPYLSWYLAFSTKPTISKAVENLSALPKRFPMGSSPGKNFRANVSLTTATRGEVGVSCSPMVRPRSTRVPIVEK